MKKFRIGLVTITFILCASPLLASADAASDLQAQIQALIGQINQIQGQPQTQTQISSPVYVPPAQPVVVQSNGYNVSSGNSNNAICYALTRTLSRGSSGSDVLALQQYLVGQGLLSSDSATGYFGALTEAAVQHWQASFGVVSSGSPSTTGYGVVGAHTRSLLQLNCTLSSSTTATAQQQQQQQVCPLAPQPSTACAGTWSPIVNVNKCTIAWQCAVPLVQPVATTSTAPNMCASSPAKPPAQCVGGGWQPTYTGSCVSAWQCASAVSSGILSASPAFGTPPFAVQFSARSGTSGTIIDFGDGQNGMPQLVCGVSGCNLSANHTYVSAGTYTAKLMSGATTLGSAVITAGAH